MSQKNWRLNGYLTVEASLIFPFVLSVCVAVIYIGIYQYNRCVLKQDAYCAALHAESLYGADNQEKYNAAYDYLQGLPEKKYLAMRHKYAVSVSGKVCVETEGSMKLPFYGAAGITQKAESKTQDAVKLIRLCRQIKKAKEGN